MSARRNLRWPKRVLTFMALAGGAACAGWYYQQHRTEEAPDYQTSVVGRAELLQVVTASGQLNPLVKVEVGSQISGNIEKLLADFNSPVKAGQTIAQLDPATYRANYVQAEGNLASAKAALELAQITEKRARELSKLSAQADYDKAVADLHQAEANLKINEGALKKAEVDLARCTISSPIDGVVISRNVDVGQTVAASLSAPVLFLIGNDLRKMQIDANVAEADIGLVEVGQDADFTVDAFAGRVFHGKVTQIRNAPKTDQNVVTYDTMIDVNNEDLKLKPGMTANLTIIVARRDNALKVANAALRFHPSGSSESKRGFFSSLLAPAAKGGPSTSPGRKKDKPKPERTVYRLCRQTGATNDASAGGATSSTLEAVVIKTGITDGVYTEVLDGLEPGDEVVTGLAAVDERSRKTFNPFVGGRRRS